MEIGKIILIINIYLLINNNLLLYIRKIFMGEFKKP